MSKIYSTFSNPGGDLKSVADEFADILNFFSQKEIKMKVDYSFVLNETVDKITSEIIASQKDIRLFHFSGHSGARGLDFPEEDFDAKHVAQFFNTISSDRSKVECVFLNGCENADIVHKLSNVPVVIGTRSIIQDSAAHKFTRDFFGGLIESESTYKQAFLDAMSAQGNLSVSIVDNTRKEGGAELAEEEQVLNDYFIIVNDQTIAERKFLFNKPKKNWTKYLVLLFIAITVVLGFMFRDSIFKSFAGYSCDPIRTSSDKCNFVIAEFTTDQNIDFNKWLYNNIRESEIIKTYLHAINLGTFEKVIRNNSVDRDSLPQLCDYDFNLTGSVTAEQNKLRADFSIFPFDSEESSTRTFTYHVGSLGGLDTLITYLDSDGANQFVLFELCVACALQKDMQVVMPVLKKLVSQYVYSPGTAESYQRMQYRLSEVALHYSDTALALKSLDVITKAANNDFVLKALEQKAIIYTQQGDINGLYETQTDYLKEVDARSTNPQKYILKKNPQQYERAANSIRLERADLIMEHREGDLIQYRPEAVKDYKHLDNVNFQDKDYTRKIEVLNIRTDVMGGNATTPQIEPARVINPVMIENIEKSVPVTVVAYKIQQQKFDKLMRQLKASGYKLNTQKSKLLTSPPRNAVKTPLVIYYNEHHAELANLIADQTSAWTSVKFKTKLVSDATDRLTTTTQRNEIGIYWPGGTDSRSIN